MNIQEYIAIRAARKNRVAIHQSEHIKFEATSMGDMAFLLLIFFIVTGSFVLRQGIFFSLPSKSASPVRVEESRIVETWPETEGFTVEGRSFSRELFKEMMKARVETVNQTVLIINMKENVRFERLVDALSVAKESGVKNVSLRNQGGIK
jgi:biopolymer transport protein ExbD